MAARKSFLLRLDPAVHDALASWAADELRSLNGHLEWVLRDALKRARRPVAPTPASSDAIEAPAVPGAPTATVAQVTPGAAEPPPPPDAPTVPEASLDDDSSPTQADGA